MKKILMVAAVALTALTSCVFTVSGNNSDAGSDQSADQTRTMPVAYFDDLTINVPCDVVYEAGEPNVVIVASEKYMEHILVEQNGKSLVIKIDDKKIRSFKNTKIYVTSDCLTSLTVNGAVDMECKHGITSPGDFALTLNGAGDVDIKGLDADDIEVRCNGAADIEILDISAANISVTINGAGDATLAGAVDTASLTINGAGDINARGLVANSIRPSVRGVGSIVTR